MNIFRRATIHLTEPICLCAEQNLAWTVAPTAAGPTLAIWCQTCGTKLQVPNKEFKAAFQLEKPYPGKPREEKKKGGEVIDFAEYLKRRKPNDLPS